MNDSEILYIRSVLREAKKSPCQRRKVGAILVKEGQILLHACNGNILPCCVCIRNQKHIQVGTHHMSCNGIHAEKRLLQYAYAHSIDTKSAIIYCTHSPCQNCAIALVNAGIYEFVYLYEYPDLAFKTLFKKNNIFFRQIDIKTLAIEILE